MSLGADIYVAYLDTDTLDAAATLPPSNDLTKCGSPPVFDRVDIVDTRARPLVDCQESSDGKRPHIGGNTP
jgi:hypothetical protein